MTPATPAADTLRAAVGRVGLATATDAELVRRFADHRDDLAFAELVHRFAPPVYAVCRRHLPDPCTADDAFQAVFILLARKAGTLVHPNRVGGWLTGTAERVARTARRRQFRRTARLRPLDSVPEPSAPDPVPSDLRTILDDELTKLPPHYRAVVLLCDVEGVSRRDAASQLNIPTGTLSNRLTRARAVLGRRLLRRGVLVSAGAVVSSGSLACPPARLLASAVRVALADSPPSELLSLLTPEIAPMPRGKLLLLLVTGLVLAGGVTTGVVLLVPKARPTAATTGEGQADPPKPTQPETKATFAISAEELAKRPQPQPRLPREDNLGAWAFSADGKWFVRSPDWWGLDAKVVVYDATSWKEKAIIEAKSLNTEWSPWSAAVSPDGKRVFLSLAGKGAGVRVWDVTAGRFEETRFESGDKFWVTLKLSADGSVLAGYFNPPASKKGRFCLWDAKAGAVLCTIEDGDGGFFGKFDFADGGKTLAALRVTGDAVRPVLTATEWDVNTGQLKRRIELTDALSSPRGRWMSPVVTYTPDGKQIVVGGGLWMPDDKRELPPGSYRNTCPFSGSVCVIDRTTGKRVKTLIECRQHFIQSLHFTPDGKKLIVNPPLPSRWDREFDVDKEFAELQQWDVATWELDWVKIVPTAERWKLWNGAAK